MDRRSVWPRETSSSSPRARRTSSPRRPTRFYITWSRCGEEVMRKETQSLAFGILMAALPCAAATAPQDAPEGSPEAVVDLTTADGVRLFAGQWRYSDAR